jgi:probable HAF family extracellular repeat protein
MRRICLAVAMVLTASCPCYAASVRALTMPVGFTVEPEDDRRGIVLGGGGAILARAHATDGSGRVRVLRWDAHGERTALIPPGAANWPARQGPPPTVEDVVAYDGDAIVTTSLTSDGSHIHTTFSTYTWGVQGVRSWAAPPCVGGRRAELRVLAAGQRRIAVTDDPSSGVIMPDLADPSSVAGFLPTAFLVEGANCTSLGDAILTGVHGRSVIGYLGYLDGRPAPWTINVMVQHMHALRWLDGKPRPRELGPGVPYATRDDGFTVGATALPGHGGESVTTNFFGPGGTYRYAIPHAVAWDRAGDQRFLVRGDARSVAYDVADDGTVVGMLQATDGKQYAFRWRHGQLQRLDDLPHPRGWRFESAYAIRDDGSIVGIGSRRGIATAFLWHDSR